MTEYQADFTGSILAKSEWVAGFGYERSFAGSILTSYSMPNPFNLTEWENANLNIAEPIYRATLETPSGAVLLTLRLKNFQAKLNLVGSNYLAVSCSNEDDFTTIQSWISSGSVFLVVRKVYRVGGVDSLEEIIARVECDTPRLDKGPTTATVTLSGYWIEEFGSKKITLPTPMVKRLVNGNFIMTFSEPNLYLRPGDIVSTPDEIDFTAGSISYVVSASKQITMTVSQLAE